MIKVEFDSASLATSLKKYAKKFDHTAEEMISDLAYKAGYEFAKYTQPFGTGLKARKQGENAVNRDIDKVYIGVGQIANELKRKSPKFAKVYLAYINVGQHDKADAYADKHLAQIVSSSFDSGRLHQRQRRKGSIAKDGFKSSASSRRSRVDQYSNKQQRKVGMAKASWVQSIQGLSLKKKSVPKWLRSSGNNTGFNSIRRKGWGTSVSITSKIPYMSNVLRGSRIAGIMKRVSRNHSKYLNKIILK